MEAFVVFNALLSLSQAVSMRLSALWRQMEGHQYEQLGLPMEKTILREVARPCGHWVERACMLRSRTSLRKCALMLLH